jgi:hypothetical protein
MAVKSAYETLSDAAKRREYDTLHGMRRFGFFRDVEPMPSATPFDRDAGGGGEDDPFSKHRCGAQGADEGGGGGWGRGQRRRRRRRRRPAVACWRPCSAVASPAHGRSGGHGARAAERRGAPTASSWVPLSVQTAGASPISLLSAAAPPRRREWEGAPNPFRPDDDSDPSTSGVRRPGDPCLAPPAPRSPGDVCTRRCLFCSCMPAHEPPPPPRARARRHRRFHAAGPRRVSEKSGAFHEHARPGAADRLAERAPGPVGHRVDGCMDEVGVGWGPPHAGVGVGVGGWGRCGGANAPSGPTGGLWQG